MRTRALYSNERYLCGDERGGSGRSLLHVGRHVGGRNDQHRRLAIVHQVTGNFEIWTGLGSGQPVNGGKMSHYDVRNPSFMPLGVVKNELYAIGRRVNKLYALGSLEMMWEIEFMQIEAGKMDLTRF